MTDFRHQIKDMQRRKGVNTLTTAKLAGLRSFATLYTYLNGKTNMTAANLTKVLETLNSLPDLATVPKEPTGS